MSIGLQRKGWSGHGYIVCEIRAEAYHIEEGLNFSTPCGPVTLVFVEFVTFEGRFYCFPLNNRSSGISKGEGVDIVCHVDSYVYR